MVDILLMYRWKYVSFINSDDTYGKSAQTEFRSRAADNDICLAVARTIPASTETYDEVRDGLFNQPLLPLQIISARTISYKSTTDSNIFISASSIYSPS